MSRHLCRRIALKQQLSSLGKHSSSEDMIVCMFFTSINRKKNWVSKLLFIFCTRHTLDRLIWEIPPSGHRRTVGQRNLAPCFTLGTVHGIEAAALFGFLLGSRNLFWGEATRPKRFQLIAHHLKRWFQLQVLAQHFVDVVVQVPDEFGERFPTLVHVVVAFLFHVGQSMGHVFGEIVATMDARQHLTQTKEQSLVPYLSFWSIVEGEQVEHAPCRWSPHRRLETVPRIEIVCIKYWLVRFLHVRSMSSDKRFHSWAFPTKNPCIDRLSKSSKRFFNRFSVNVNFFSPFWRRPSFSFFYIRIEKKATWTKMAGPCIRNDVFIDCCRKI